ncbi:MAG TPA: tellurite resistance/C4-dicarboxylate transporter family protein [Mycobacterium sp.]|nr:tellurite resistance/C4-dicarboxylate transporter family protein [Mycobacterium sp.]
MRFRLPRIQPSPDVFAAVMATGILSIAARDHHYRWISDTLGGLATVGMAVLVLLVTGMAVSRRTAIWDLRDPDTILRLFSFVAACAVLDSRLTVHPAVVVCLGVVALLSWLTLGALAVRAMAARSWAALRDEAHGAWELGSVGTSGLTIVTAQAARYTGDDRWLVVAVPIWVLAIGIYALMTWLILWRSAAERGGSDGFEPDTWILMGGLAIATLAGDTIHQVAPHWLATSVRVVTLVTWLVATLWIPPLIYFVLHRIDQRPGMLHFAGVWWAVVFPLGMYSVATDASAAELGSTSMRTVSLVFFWDALAAWLIVVLAGLLRFRRVLVR